jgi:subtilase family serine protease
MSISRPKFGATPLRSAPYATRRHRTTRANLNCESLELRQLLSADASVTSLNQITAHTNLTVVPAVTTASPTGLTPQQLQNAYGVNLISFSGGTISGTGAGQTIAIVDAYSDPNITADLAAFDKQFGLPAPPSFTVDNLGATTTDAGWALETALDVEWAHAIAPQANILLVESPDASLGNLFYSVRFASQQAGVSVVSMSWGSNEFASESLYNNVLVTPARHANVAYVAASGDQGAWSGPQFPSVLPNVLAVGGTTLSLTSSGAYSSESGWSGSTGGFSGLDSGFSSFQTEPSYQTSTLASVGLSFGVRTTPDVSFNADPNSGVSVYDSVSYNGQSGWFTLGGTSAAAPAWAGLVAITDQGLATAGQGSLNTTQVLTNLYSLPSSDFNDVTTGFNGYSATPGYDLVTGLGTPKANLVVSGVLAANGVATTSVSATPTPTPTPNPTPTSTPTHHTTTRTTHSGSASKADQISSTTAASGSSTQFASTSPVTNTSTSSGIIVLASSVTTAATTSTQSSLDSSSSSSAGNVQQAVATTANAFGQSITSLNAPSGRLAPDNSQAQGLDGLTETTDPSAPIETTHNTTTLQKNVAEENPMPTPGRPADEQSSIQTPVERTRSWMIPSNDEFDAALEQVIAIMRKGRFNSLRSIKDVVAETTNSARDVPSVSALVGAAAIGGVGYRLVLRSPDDEKRRSWWYARFPGI